MAWPIRPSRTATSASCRPGRLQCQRAAEEAPAVLLARFLNRNSATGQTYVRLAGNAIQSLRKHRWLYRGKGWALTLYEVLFLLPADALPCRRDRWREIVPGVLLFLLLLPRANKNPLIATPAGGLAAIKARRVKKPSTETSCTRTGSSLKLFRNSLTSFTFVRFLYILSLAVPQVVRPEGLSDRNAL